MTDDIWAIAAEKAEKAECRSGMTPYRRGIVGLFRTTLTAAIKARLENKSHLPHGRLGTLLQAAEPRALAIMALEAVAPQIGRPRRRKSNYEFERDLKIAIGETFYANVTMAKAAKEAKGKDLRRLQWRRFVLQGKLKPTRHETPTDWLARLRRTRFAIWRALTKDATREEQIRAGSWLLARAVEADLVILVGKDLLPASRWREELKRLQGIIIRANVRLLPLAEKPAHWKKPEIYRSGLKVSFLPHWNRAHQASIAASFRNPRFHHQHLAAINRLADVPLSVDEWTSGLVHSFAVEVRSHNDADRRRAYETQVERDLQTAGMMVRRGEFHNSYHIDSRGRLYADQAFNYAQRDSVRSMFRFARGAEITGAGLQWLMIHVANCYGEDKLPYAGRIAWTTEHYDDIERVANDPRGSFDFWRNADKPFALRRPVASW